MSFYTVILYFFMALAAISAIGIVFVKNVFKGALLLLICLLSLAAIYIFLHAEFLAAAQIMIYAGGILVVIIFGVMLTTKFSGKPLVVRSTNLFAGLLAGALILSLLVRFYAGAFETLPGNLNHADNLYNTGVELMTSHVLPFEIAGILLLITLIGAAVVTSAINKKI